MQYRADVGQAVVEARKVEDRARILEDMTVANVNPTFGGIMRKNQAHELP